MATFIVSERLKEEVVYSAPYYYRKDESKKGTRTILQVSKERRDVEVMLSSGPGDDAKTIEYVDASLDIVKGALVIGMAVTPVPANLVFGAIAGVAALVQAGMKFYSAEDPLKKRMEELTNKIKELDEKTKAHFLDMKSFITENQFNLEIVAEISTMKKYMQDCLEYHNQRAIDNFLAAYKHKTPLDMAYVFMCLLKQKSTNPLIMEINKEEENREAIIKKWVTIFNSIMGDLKYLEAFGSGLFKYKSEHDWDRLMELTDELTTEMKEWKGEEDNDKDKKDKEEGKEEKDKKDEEEKRKKEEEEKKKEEEARKKIEEEKQKEEQKRQDEDKKKTEEERKKKEEEEKKKEEQRRKEEEERKKEEDKKKKEEEARKMEEERKKEEEKRKEEERKKEEQKRKEEEERKKEEEKKKEEQKLTWEKFKANLENFATSHTHLGNAEKAASLKQQLETIDSTDSYYIFVFNECRIDQKAEFNCTNDQMVSCFGKGKCSVVVYRSQTANSRTTTEFQKIQTDVEACKNKLRDKQFIEKNLLRDYGFVCLINKDQNVAVVHANSKNQRGPGGVTEATLLQGLLILVVAKDVYHFVASF